MLGKARVKCFNAVYGAGSYVDRADLGYQVVPVERIVGSVGRCQELDDRFHPLRLTRPREQRLQTIRNLARQGAGLPPVELYKLKDEYYVIDGNHRVAVAKEDGQLYTDAHVVEFLPSGQRAEDRLYLEQRAFAGQTGLAAIRLGQLGGFARLRREIGEHRAKMEASGGEVALAEAARDWYRQAFEPVAFKLDARGLPQRSGHTAGDLYLDLQGRRAYARQVEQRELSWDEAIAQLAACYPQPRLGDRLAQVRARLLGRAEALPRELPCAFACQAPSGAVCCCRAERAERGVFGS